MTRYQNPLDRLSYWTQQNPDKEFLIQPLNGELKTYTWAETTRQVRRMASAIKALNLPPGSRIAIFSKNCAHWIMADLAIWLSGNVSVPLYPTLNSETINLILNHCEAELLFMGKLDEPILKNLKIERKIPTISFPYMQHANSMSWDDLVEKSPDWTGSTVREPSELATIIYTSGTTGMPKGVMHNFNTFSICPTLGVKALDFVDGKEKFFSYLPLAHVAERFLVEIMGLYSGGSITFVESLDTFVDDLKRCEPTVFLAVPRIWQKFREGILKKMPQEKLDKLLAIPILSGIVKRKIRKGLGLNKATTCLTGAAATPTDLLYWYAKLGISIQEAYGMTENFAYSQCSFRGRQKFGCVGQNLPLVETILSPEGEVLVKSPGTMMGYYKEEKKTQEAMQGDFLRTGDLGQVQPEGFLALVGRLKDTFKTSKGKYVAPAPIELELAKSPLIEQVCVLGSGLPQPIAIAVLSADAQAKGMPKVKEEFEKLLKRTNQGLNQHEHLAKFVVLSDAWTIENGFLTPTMKVKRNLIEKKYLDDLPVWSEKPERVLHVD